MNSYAIYRISETLRVLFFMTLAILVFNFYPLTAVMIVMLALLNDGAILSIAYDNVRYRNQPEAWNMRVVLGISTVLGFAGVVSAFGLFYLGERVFHLDRAHIQTLMYLKLSVAGHLTIFLTRTRGPFWSIRPAPLLWAAVVGTQAVATVIAVYGVFMTPLGWGWAGFVWGYALVWFLVNDRMKLLAYWVVDRARSARHPTWLGSWPSRSKRRRRRMAARQRCGQARARCRAALGLVAGAVPRARFRARLRLGPPVRSAPRSGARTPVGSSAERHYSALLASMP